MQDRYGINMDETADPIKSGDVYKLKSVLAFGKRAIVDSLTTALDKTQSK